MGTRPVPSASGRLVLDDEAGSGAPDPDSSSSTRRPEALGTGLVPIPTNPSPRARPGKLSLRNNRRRLTRTASGRRRSPLCAARPNGGHLVDQLGDQVSPHRLRATFRAVAAVLDPAEVGVDATEVELVDTDQPRLEKPRHPGRDLE